MRTLYAIVIPLGIGILLYRFSNFVDFEPQPYRITTFDQLTGVLKENFKLSDGERLFEGRLFGPESLVAHNGSIYTGTSDGCIMKITENDFTCFTRIMKRCGDANSKCSRPLGVRFDKEGTLYVVDGVLGVFSVDIKTGSVTPLIKSGEMVDGSPLRFPDDLTISNDGVIYFSEASVKWTLENCGLIAVEHENSGRIIKFDKKTKRSSVLLDGLFFPNGVQLSKSGDSLLIAEFLNHRILRYYLVGDKKGHVELFANLPGPPDNIRSSKNGYWVALLNYHNPAKQGIMDRLSEYPFLRKLIIRFQQSMASLLLFVNHYWNCQQMHDYAVELQSGFSWILPSVMHGMAIELDESGKFIQTVQSPDGRNGMLSEILEHDGYIYAGSYLNPFLIRMKNEK